MADRYDVEFIENGETKNLDKVTILTIEDPVISPFCSLSDEEILARFTHNSMKGPAVLRIAKEVLRKYPKATGFFIRIHYETNQISDNKGDSVIIAFILALILGLIFSPLLIALGMNDVFVLKKCYENAIDCPGYKRFKKLFLINLLVINSICVIAIIIGVLNLTINRYPFVATTPLIASISIYLAVNVIMFVISIIGSNRIFKVNQKESKKVEESAADDQETIFSKTETESDDSVFKNHCRIFEIVFAFVSSVAVGVVSVAFSPIGSFVNDFAMGFELLSIIYIVFLYVKKGQYKSILLISSVLRIGLLIALAAFALLEKNDIIQYSLYFVEWDTILYFVSLLLCVSEFVICTFNGNSKTAKKVLIPFATVSLLLSLIPSYFLMTGRTGHGVGKYLIVVFDTGGGSTIAPQKINRDEELVLPDAPIKGGYEFDYWNITSTYDRNYAFPANAHDSIIVSENLTIVAVWTEI